MADLRDFTKKNPIFVGTDGIRLPSGNSAQRVASANVAGTLRYNADINGMEFYSPNGWIPVAAPPSISTVTPSTYTGVSGTEFTIDGSSFSPDAQVYFITSNGTTMLASTVTYIGNAQLKATTPRAIKVEEEPISVRVNQSSGVTTKLDCIDAGGVPNWITTAGTLGSIFGVNTVNVYVSATDPEGSAITYQITSGSLPGGLNFSTANGLVQGLANSVIANTTYNFTIKASDTVNNNTDRSFSYTVLNRAPIINTAAGSLGTIFSGNAASASISAYDPDGGSLTYTVSSGTLPANSSLGSANGVISGTPIVVTTNTTYSFTLTSTDEGSLTASNNYTFTVLNRPPLWNTAASLSDITDDNVSIYIANTTINAYDPDGGSITYSLISGSLPSGMTLVSANGALAGPITPVDSNTTSTFTITATDVGAMSNTRTFSLTIQGPLPDAQFANTVLLLRGTANTIIKESSTNNLPITVVGDSRASNFNPYNTSWSNYFGGSDYLTFTPTTALQLANNNFTIEMWVNFSVVSATRVLNNYGYEPGGAKSFIIYYDSSTLHFGYSTDGTNNTDTSMGAFVPVVNTWYHIAVVRNSTTVTGYVNGVALSAPITIGTATIYYPATSGAFRIGVDSSNYFNGYISNYRLVKGTAVYIAAFTSPTSALTAVANTVLLTCQSNRFVDNSTNNLTVAPTGSPTVSGFSPFAETDTSNGSMYFDGTGDYLTIPNDTAFSYSSTFSAELWYYSTHTSCTDVIPFSGNGNWDFIIPAATTVAFRWFVPGYSDTGAHTMIPNSWNHIAVSVSGGRLSFYLNGIRKYTNDAVSFSLGGSDTSKIGYGSNSLMKGYISNVRVTRGSTPYDPTQTTITVPTSPLTAISGTTFLTLQNRKGHNNHAFIDESTSKSLITRNGNTTQGTFTPFSQTGWSNYFGATGTYLTVTSQPLINVNDWTVEFWMYPTQFNNNGGIFGASNGGGTNPKLYLYVTGANLIIEGYSGGFFTALSTAQPTLNQWTYVSVSRSSSTGNAYIYYNGVLQGSAAAVPAITGITGGFSLLSNGEGSSAGFYGYMSNMRVSNVARYTGSSYSVPTTASTAIANTTLLTAQSNRFVDNSSNGYAIAVTGTPSVQAFSPFAPTAAYDAAIVGGSGYFDGTGDYLSVGVGTDFNLGTSDFSMEFWYYCTAVGSYAPGLVCKRVGGVATGWGMQASGFTCDMGGTWYDSWSNPYWVGSIATAGFNAGTSLTKLNQWTHVVLTRQGTNARWFVNGQLLGYQSRTGAIQQLTGSTLSIGLNGTTAEQPFTGYLSGGRICIGSVPTEYQTSSTTLNAQIFTPSTAPVTLTSQGAASANVKYIGNFTNAGIFDSTAKNVFETVGDAKVNTAQSKFSGSGAMYFAGSGNYLRAPYSPNLVFGTADFTFECQLYWTGGNSENNVIMNNASGGFNLKLQATNAANWALENSYVGQVADFGTAPTKNTWHHIAITRASGTLRAFIDGTQVYSGANATDFTNTAAWAIGGNLSSNSLYMTGFLYDLRITKGYARYTTTFTPPTKSFAGK
jgi:hypothetical protein